MNTKTYINYISLIIAVSAFLSISSTSQAAKKSKKKHQGPAEVYSATESDSPGALSLGDKGLWENDGSKVKAEALKGGMMTSDNEDDEDEKPVAKTPSIPVKINEFDPVDPKQIDSISSRIRLVEQIIRKHKRAYDYRSNTTLELIEVMRFLDKTAAASKK